MWITCGLCVDFLTFCHNRYGSYMIPDFPGRRMLWLYSTGKHGILRQHAGLLWHVISTEAT